MRNTNHLTHGSVYVTAKNTDDLKRGRAMVFS